LTSIISGERLISYPEIHARIARSASVAARRSA
jgi:hypothetical protein